MAYSACGHCLSAWETVCAKAGFGGYARDGGFAEYTLADPDHVARALAGLAARKAAPLICAGITSHKGLRATKARPGERVAISGMAAWGTLRSSMPRRWACRFAPWTSTTASWPMPRA